MVLDRGDLAAEQWSSSCPRVAQPALQMRTGSLYTKAMVRVHAFCLKSQGVAKGATGLVTLDGSGLAPYTVSPLAIVP